MFAPVGKFLVYSVFVVHYARQNYVFRQLESVSLDRRNSTIFSVNLLTHLRGPIAAGLVVGHGNTYTIHL